MDESVQKYNETTDAYKNMYIQLNSCIIKLILVKKLFLHCSISSVVVIAHAFL